jgi:hypothetical protein
MNVILSEGSGFFGLRPQNDIRYTVILSEAKDLLDVILSEAKDLLTVILSEAKDLLDVILSEAKDLSGDSSRLRRSE